MLDKLIISKNSAGDSTKLRGLFLSISIFVTSIFTFGLVFSLFSQNLALGNDSLNISTLIAPPAVPTSEPPKPRTEQPQQNKDPQKSPSITTRKENILRIDETPNIPNTISTSKSKSEVRPNIPFSLGAIDQTIPSGPSNNAPVGSRCSDCSTTGKSIGADNDSGAEVIKTKDTTRVGKPPAIKKPESATIVSLGVLNSVAKNLVTPAYPAAARAIGANGRVTVQVLIDENGRVINAAAMDGHPLLRDVALRAARSSTFTPTLLSKVPVKARGIIIYNFKK